MGTRRDFLQLGVAASALPFAERVLGAAFSPTSTSSASLPVMSLYKTVFDERFPASVAFARRMQELGAVPHGITGDITDFWFHELHARWLKEPVAIAGLTAHGPLFCLERLSWDHQMRVVYRAEHRLRDDGRIEHVLSGPESMMSAAGDLVAGGRDWSLHVANVVSRCPHVCSDRTETTIVASLPNAAAGGASVEEFENVDGPLISWVIAPVAPRRRA